jgi:signal transduction histidine kinase
MISHEQRVSLLEFLYRKPGVELPVVTEVTGVLEILIQDVFDDLQRSKVELRQQVTNLQARNKELEAYAHMVAHDLKDPLTVLITTSDLIIKIPNPTRKELKGDLQRIRSTSLEMNRIINNLMLFAEVSKAEAPLELVNMAQVVARVQDRLSHLIEEQQAQISIPKVWPDAIGYAPWLEEVWANYLSNALKHGGNPPHVELGASAQSDGMVRFWTRDEGSGLPTEIQAHLFKPYSQIDHFSDSGHGLGLSIVFAIVEKLGGQVGVESEPGQGSLFFFTLPAELSSPTIPATTMA